MIMETYAEAPNRQVTAANAIDYAYREVGQGAVPARNGEGNSNVPRLLLSEDIAQTQI
jgi:hypothetical protein